MASTDTLLTSDPKEHKWVVEITEIFNHQLETVFETPSVSLFQVPETITQKKPDAYEPQQIGLGPIHHFRSRPYKKMEQRKLAVMKIILEKYRIKDNFKPRVVEKVREFVPMLRSCYDMFLEHNDDSLATIFAIDGLFLLNLFHTYNAPVAQNLRKEILKEMAKLKEKANKYAEEEVDELLEEESDRESDELSDEELYQLLEKEGVVKRLVAQDMLMVENQIPFMVLKEINNILDPSGNFSPFVFRTFCEVHSPLKLCSRSQAPPSADHLLHYMYNSIVNNYQPIPLCMASPLLCLKFISQVPQKEIVQVHGQAISILENFCKKVHVVPSASNLHEKSGFRFLSLQTVEGIQNIGIINKVIYLPIITLNNDSDVILRNLVAYETLTSNSESFPLSEYMGLMCELIRTKDDAKFLKSQNVITGDMDADEVAKLFIGMSSSIPTTKTKKKSKLQLEVIDEINKVYESRLSMKTYLLFKKLAGWLLVALRAIGSFVESSWKIVAFMISIVTVFMLTWQAYCNVYGCDKQTVTLLPYASS